MSKFFSLQKGSMGDIETETASSPSKNESKSGSDCLVWQNVDDGDVDPLKKDDVGAIACSSHWILATLIELFEIDESNSCDPMLKKDLRTIWNMTAEHNDLVLLLWECDFGRLAELILRVSDDRELWEIIMGILLNMSHFEDILESMAECKDLLSVIYSRFFIEETTMLMQTIKLFQSVFRGILKNPTSRWIKHVEHFYFGEHLVFILQNSTNVDLLKRCFDLVGLIVMVDNSEMTILTNLIRVSNLTTALMEGFYEVMKQKYPAHSDEQLKFIDNWLNTFSNIIDSEVVDFAQWFDLSSINDILKILSIIIQPYVKSENFFPLTERLAVCIRNAVEMIHWLYRNGKILDCKAYHIICVTVKVMHALQCAINQKKVIKCKVTELQESKELLRYLERFLISIWLDWKSGIEDGRIGIQDQVDAYGIVKLVCREEVIDNSLAVIKRYLIEYPNKLGIRKPMHIGGFMR